MMNLLPPQEKALNKQKYYQQLLFWVVLFSGIIFSVCTILLIPSYISLRYQLTLYEQEKADNENRVKDLEEMRVTIAETNKLATKISEHQTGHLISEIINSVWVRAGESVMIESISYGLQEQGKEMPPTLKVSGQASDRQALTAFSTRLLENKRFVDVDVPISSLAKDTNVPFELVVTLRTDNI